MPSAASVCSLRSPHQPPRSTRTDLLDVRCMCQTSRVSSKVLAGFAIPIDTH